MLGQRFKTKIPALKKAVGNLTRDQIGTYERTHQLEVEGCQLREGDMKVGTHISWSESMVENQNPKNPDLCTQTHQGK